MKCPLKDCKFNHGKPLTDQFRGILLKHLETAPKEILGDFPRIGREKALKLMDAQHLKLLAKERGDKEPPETLSNTPNIPSLLDSIMPKRGANNDNRGRRTRWHDMAVPPAPTLPTTTPESKAPIPEYMSIKNMTGILTQKQIEELLEMGIESVEQIKQLTLAQMDKLGLTISQITEIQSNVQNMEKVMKEKKEEKHEQTSQNSKSPPSATAAVINQDLDLRIPPLGSVVPDHPPPKVENIDLDMRLLPPPVSLSATTLSSNIPITSSTALQALDHVKKDPEPLIDPQKLQDFRNMFGPSTGNSSLVDFSQYLKDAHMKETLGETDEPENRKNQETPTPDEESELQIDESWYSDEEKDTSDVAKESKEEEKKSDDLIISPVHTQESIIATLKELEKAKQKEQEAKQHENLSSSSLLPSTYNPAIESTFNSFYEAPKVEKAFPDPRTRRVSINEIKSPSLSDSADESVVKRPSIYDQYSDDENDDYGNISKKTDKDMRLAPLESDALTGDIDFRLPFKPILASHIPASEINGSINTHPPIDYKVSFSFLT